MKLSVRRVTTATTMAAALVAAACGGSGNSATSTPPCDQSCADTIALRSLRDAMKVVYNVTLQGKPVGAQDATTRCPLGGTAHVYGRATSNAAQGATSVKLTYVFAQCAFSETDTDPNQTFSMTLTGTVTEDGTIAVQPSSTSALMIQSDAVTLMGTVYTPAAAYDATCAAVLGQSGNELSGTLCERTVGVSL